MAKKQHRKQPPTVPKRRKWKFLVIGILVLALGVLAVCLRPGSSRFPRLEVAGFQISEEEYLRAMYQARNEVLSDHAAAGISLKDWSAETALGDPTLMTMDRALEILTEHYAVSTLAVERGYLSDAGYEAMKRDMEQSNRKRQEAMNSGTVITGIPHFTLEDYITYRASSIRLQFCTDAENPEYQVTQEEIRKRYEDDREDLYRQPDSMELAFLLSDTDPEETDELQREFEMLRQKALEQGSLTLALEEMPQLKVYYQEISVNSGTYGGYSRSHGDVLIWAETLRTDQVSEVFRQENRLCLIQCMERTVHQYEPLQSVESVVAQSIRESRYEDLIARRMSEIRIRGELEKLQSFTAEQLH